MLAPTITVTRTAVALPDGRFWPAMVAADNGVTGKTTTPQNGFGGLPDEILGPLIGAALLPVGPLATTRVAETAQLIEVVRCRLTEGPVKVMLPPVLVGVAFRLN